MISIGLCGNIGSGKSSIAKIFQIHGFNIFDADKLAKELYHHNNIRQKIETLLGFSIELADNKINYSAIAEVYFNDDKLYHRINAILYPALKSKISDIINNSSSNILIEAAMLYEIELHPLFDFVITVSSPDILRQERLQKQRNMDTNSFRKREKMQSSQLIKEKRSNFVIYNNEEELIIPQIEKILNTIST